MKSRFKKSRRWVCVAFMGALAIAAMPPTQSLGPKSGEAGPIKAAVRRITETQYRHTIADVFGPEVKINARFEPQKREDGLLAIGNAHLSLTSSGFEQYFALASSIAEQALDEKKRAKSVPCKPAYHVQSDTDCAATIVDR